MTGAITDVPTKNGAAQQPRRFKNKIIMEVPSVMVMKL